MNTGTWPQAYYDWASGVIVADSGARRTIAPRAPVAELLNALPNEVRRVYLCGTLPGSGASADHPGMRAIDHTLLWGATLSHESGWGEDLDRRHYCSDEGNPGSLFLRYRHLATADCTVEVGCLARWVGDVLALSAMADSALVRSAAPDDGRWLFAWLASVLNEAFVVQSKARWRRPPAIYGTPNLTGRTLLELTLRNAHRELPLLSDTEQAFIRSILPQARVERFAAPVEGATLPPGASYMDGRLMYAASMRDLGTGPLTRDEAPDFVPDHPGFYHVRFRVPDTWNLPGILPVKNGERSSDGWRWPSAPREQAETWAGERELKAALWPQPHVCPDCAAGRAGKRGGIACATHGWHIQVLERALLVKPSSGPLNLWAKKLIHLYLNAKTCAGSDGRYELAAAAIRSLLIDTLGSLHARAETRRLARFSTSGDAIPPGVRVLAVPAADGGLVYRWNEPVPPDPVEEAREARWHHPEFCAQVWSRCRGRLLLANVVMGEQRAMTGMLALPPQSVVAVQTDALLLTHDPHWPDDGRPGRLRAKRVLRETATWPGAWKDVETVKARMASTTGIEVTV